MNGHLSAPLANGQATAPQLNGTATKTSQASSSMEKLCLDLNARVSAFLAQNADDEALAATQAQVRIAKDVVDDALRRYRPEELSISYNGGKDCLVLLILILAALPTHFSNSQIATAFPDSLQALYIQSSSPFKEVEEFVVSSSATYHLALTRYCLDMKSALGLYLKERETVKAIFIGTRRTDPHGSSLTSFDETDGDWPRIMRIHPVIDWHYRDIWTFIRALDIPYCPLYDMGYTSLGGTEDTHPNPALKEESSGAKSFRPAYELTEDNEERLGRGR